MNWRTSALCWEHSLWESFVRERTSTAVNRSNPQRIIHRQRCPNWCSELSQLELQHRLDSTWGKEVSVWLSVKSELKNSSLSLSGSRSLSLTISTCSLLCTWLWHSHRTASCHCKWVHRQGHIVPLFAHLHTRLHCRQRNFSQKIEMCCLRVTLHLFSQFFLFSSHTWLPKCWCCKRVPNQLKNLLPKLSTNYSMPRLAFSAWCRRSGNELKK